MAGATRLLPVAAIVRQADRQLRKAVEHPAEHEVRGRDRRLEGIAEEVGEVMRREPLVPDHLDRMQEQRQAERLDAFVHREERGIGQLLVQHVRGRVEAAHARQPRGTLDLAHGEIGFVHGQRGKAVETPGMTLVRGGEGVVVGLAQSLREIAPGPVDHRLREREQVHLDTLGVHRREPRIQIDELRHHRPGGEIADLELLALSLDRPVLETVGPGIRRDEVEERLREVVGVDVDGVSPVR